MDFTAFLTLTFVVVLLTMTGIGWLDRQFPEAWEAVNRGQWRMYRKAGRGLRRTGQLLVRRFVK